MCEYCMGYGEHRDGCPGTAPEEARPELVRLWTAGRVDCAQGRMESSCDPAYLLGFQKQQAMCELFQY
jgi:hypothetical protein